MNVINYVTIVTAIVGCLTGVGSLIITLVEKARKPNISVHIQECSIDKDNEEIITIILQITNLSSQAQLLFDFITIFYGYCRMREVVQLEIDNRTEELPTLIPANFRANVKLNVELSENPLDALFGEFGLVSRYHKKDKIVLCFSFGTIEVTLKDRYGWWVQSKR